MDIKQAVITCVVDKKFNWQDRATRSEYWWFYLASIIINIVASIFNIIPILGALISFAVSIALMWLTTVAAIRRLHDTDHRGWWLLIPLATTAVGIFPFSMGLAAYAQGDSGAAMFAIGLLIMLSGYAYVIYLLIQPGTAGPNRFGPAPVCDTFAAAPAAEAAPQVSNSAPADMPQDNNEQK